MLNHINKKNNPSMVDVGSKELTRRSAIAIASIVFPSNISFKSKELKTKKGPVFDTAITAGVMAVKKTHELIPLCHPIPIDKCNITIDWVSISEIIIKCEVSAIYKTGVEMEALTGVTTASLPVYDMCISLSHEILIKEIKLLSKSGGKSDFVRAND